MPINLKQPTPETIMPLSVAKSIARRAAQYRIPPISQTFIDQDNWASSGGIFITGAEILNRHDPTWHARNDIHPSKLYEYTEYLHPDGPWFQAWCTKTVRAPLKSTMERVTRAYLTIKTRSETLPPEIISSLFPM